MWEVKNTDQFDDWIDGLTEDEQEQVVAAVEELRLGGPALRRPLVGPIQTSRHRNMKELIPPSSNIRILFAFNPRREAILLVGGDKTNAWDRWYRRNVPIADDLYDRHLADLRR